MILKTAKQERTINPDTRLHSDEMRYEDEKKRRLARNPREGNINGDVAMVMSGQLAHRSAEPGCNLQLKKGISISKGSQT